MNRINQLFANRGERKLLSLYFCAGAPALESTGEVILAMQRRAGDRRRHRAPGTRVRAFTG